VWEVVQNNPYTGVHPNGPRILGKSDLGRVSLGAAWTWRIPAVAGSGKFTWSLASGKLPQGLTLDEATGLITGTPVEAEISQFEIAVKDQDPKRTVVAKRAYKVECFMPATPVIATKELAPAAVGGKHWQKVEVESCYGKPSFAVSKGQLPVGLTLDKETGEISGTATKVGVFQIAITITDKKGRTGTKALKFTVAGKNTNGMTCELYCRSITKADGYKKYINLRDDVMYIKGFTLDLVDDIEEPFVLRFLCDVKIEKPGTYKFFLNAKQGGSISVNGQQLCEKDFTKKSVDATGEIKLEAGAWPLEVMFWKRGISGRSYMKWKVEWEGPGFKRQAIPKAALLYREANSAQR